MNFGRLVRFGAQTRFGRSLLCGLLFGAMLYALPAGTPQHSTPAVAAASGQTHVSTSAAYPSCLPLTFGLPAQVSLAAASAGLSQQTDAPTWYTIYGNTADELRAQIQACAPSSGSGGAEAEFSGETAYDLNWQYDTVMTGTACRISNVKVGVHTAIALPRWQPTAQAAAGLGERWQQFISSLQTHEQGHVAIDTAYSTQLLNDLNRLGSVACDTVADRVSAIVNSDVAALNQANDTYDVQTNHGATQGAILPTY